MKNKFGISSIVITAVCGALQVSAQQTAPANSPNGDAWKNGQNGMYHLGKTERAEKIIGREVRDSQDEKIGSVKDLAIDLQNGRIAEVIVGTGGVLGVDEKYVAVPPDALTCDPARKEFQLNMDKAKFTSAPSFKMADWQANASQPSVEGVYQYYGAKPYFTSAGSTQPDQNNNNNNVTGQTQTANANPSAETAANHGAFNQSLQSQNQGATASSATANQGQTQDPSAETAKNHAAYNQTQQNQNGTAAAVNQTDPNQTPNPDPSAETAKNHAAYQSLQNQAAGSSASGVAWSGNKPEMCRFGQLERADKIIGSTVHNMQNERLGRINDLVVDLRGGRILEVILSSGGFLGMGDELSAIPPQSFRQGTDMDTVTLDTTKEALASNPHFKSAQWPDFNNTQYDTTVYRAYNVRPYFDTAADNTAQNVRDRDGNTLTPLNQGTSDADMETTRQIRKEVIAASGLSVNARNVKIITIDGKVTLRGTVNSDDEKRMVEDIAVRVASKANVDDQLLVENTARSSAQ